VLRRLCSIAVTKVVGKPRSLDGGRDFRCTRERIFKSWRMKNLERIASIDIAGID
jgi:hypothetical protein